MTDVDVTLKVNLTPVVVQPGNPTAFAVSDAHDFTVLVPRQDGTWQPATLPPGPMYVMDHTAWQKFTRPVMQSRRVHDHGPTTYPGTDCVEFDIDGFPYGDCLVRKMSKKS